MKTSFFERALVVALASTTALGLMAQVSVTGNQINTFGPGPGGTSGYYLTTGPTQGAGTVNGHLILADTAMHLANPGTSCLNTFDFSTVDRFAPLGGSSGTDETKRPSLMGGNGPQSFYLEFLGNMFIPTVFNGQALYGIGWDLLIDGDPVTTPGAVQQLPGGFIGNVNQGGSFPIWGMLQKLKITHEVGESIYCQDSANCDVLDYVHEFRLRPYLRTNQSGTTREYCPAEVRFEAVMVGGTITELIGYFDTPMTPLNILRDPPGDQSYSSYAAGSTNCVGEVVSVSADENQNEYATARVGISGSVTFGVVGVNIDIYSALTGTETAGRQETSVGEYKTCLTTTNERRTAETGPPDDLFFASSVRYAYGMGRNVYRDGCAAPWDTAQLVIAPAARLGSVTRTESYLRNITIPGLQDTIALFPQGSTQHTIATRQLSVWQQALDINDAIKAGSQGGTLIDYVSSAGAQTETSSTTTSETRSIDYTVYLENGLNAEMGALIGGTGIIYGGGMSFRQTFGSTTNSSNEHTNTNTYVVDDDDDYDRLVFWQRDDRTFGNKVFILSDHPDSTQTSCPYEGGYAWDQPELWVGSIGNDFMVQNQVPFGTAASYPLYLCNNTDTTRTYHLRFRTNSNTEGAVLTALGNPLNSTGNGQDIELYGGQCLGPVNLTLQEPVSPLGPDYDVELYLYSLCEQDAGGTIESSIFVEAHFGPGNFGSICVPTSDSAAVQGDWVDGVQIGAIDNTGSGGPGAPAYTDYTGQFSTPLSRNALTTLTITSGNRYPDRFAAWIDFDLSGTFESGEKLGEFVTSAPFESQDITFTVPAGATLGSTIMRVRSARSSSPLQPCLPYTYGETEDYAVVINSNTPQDCAGTPNGTALPGTTCDDGDPQTGNDTWNANCNCVGQPLDCTGTPNGTALPGTTCSDGDPNTAGDVYDANCNCIGLLIDCNGIPGGNALPGAFCDDGDPNTALDTWDGNCNCAGLLVDCAGTPGGSALPGAPCDDFNPLSTNDTWTANCACVGTLPDDCLGVPGGTAQPGTPCNDGDPNTGNDVYGPNCLCAGLPFDCAGTPGGNALPGSPCNDFDPQTTNDTWDANCNCNGTLLNDCLGVPGGTAQPGTSCDDGDPNTGNDAYDSNCNCAGLLIDCFGVPGGPALPGQGCDDGDPNTGNDQYDSNCNCVGQLLDCTFTPGGTALPGTPCDDGDPNTSNDTWNANCVCAGTLPADCEGTPGGTAQPGTPCDDGDPNTGNDTWSGNCDCIGLPIDCEGVIGGAALPGTACDDGDPCTSGDVLDSNCGCAGTPLSVGTVNGPTSVDAGLPITLYITPVPGATSYSWDLPAGWSSSNTNDFVLVATAGITTGPVDVCVNVVANGCTLQGCQTVDVTGSTGLGESTQEAWFTVRPNPSQGIFLLTPGDGMNNTLTVQVLDGTGRVVLAPQPVTNAGPVTLDLQDVAPGAYYLMATHDGQHQVVQLLVQH